MLEAPSIAHAITRQGRITSELFASQEGSEEGDVFQSKKLILTKFKWLSRPHVFDEGTQMVQGDDSSGKHGDQSSDPRSYIHAEWVC